jgi:hypothetical protein
MSSGGRNRAHFGEKWIDFARGLFEGKEGNAMQDHLDSGCVECAKAYAFYQKLYQAAQREASYEPPESVVHIVKTAFSATHKQPVGRFAKAQLLFNSLLNPLPVGVRSAGAASRQMLYGSGQYRVDLRIERQIDSEHISVVGQLLDAAGHGAPVEGARVTLEKRRKVIAETTTSRHGEFYLDCRTESVRLHVAVTGQEFVIPLAESNAATIGKAGLQVTRPRKRNSK